MMKKSILVVDDDAMNLKRAQMILQHYYNILLAESGKEALDKIKKLKVEIPVIFLTASGYEDDVKAAIRLGAVNYLKKPFFPGELLKRVAMGFEEK